MYGIIELERLPIDVIIPEIPGLREEVAFDGTNFYSLQKQGNDVSAGTSHTLVLLDNKIYGCGDNNNKQLLNSEDEMVLTLRELPLGELQEKAIVSVKAGNGFSLALTSDGKVFGWGGTLLQPTQLNDLEVNQIDCGYSHVIAKNSFGNIFVWKIGEAPTEIPGYLATKVYSKGNRFGIVDVAGDLHIWNWIEDGAEYSREFSGIQGGIKHAALGLDKLVYGNSEELFVFDFSQTVLYQVNPGDPITSITCGNNFYLVSLQQRIKANGTNNNGKLGSGDEEDFVTSYDEFVDVLIGDITPIVISSGLEHTIVLDSNNRIYTWGSGDSGRLGTGDTDDRNAPIEIFIQ